VRFGGAAFPKCLSLSFMKKMPFVKFINMLVSLACKNSDVVFDHSVMYTRL